MALPVFLGPDLHAGPKKSGKRWQLRREVIRLGKQGLRGGLNPVAYCRSLFVRFGTFGLPVRTGGITGKATTMNPLERDLR